MRSLYQKANKKKEIKMKKLLTTLILAGALLIAASAQETSTPPASAKPGMGPGFNPEKCTGNGPGVMGHKMGNDHNDRFQKGGMGKEPCGPAMMEQLGLSKDQSEKIHQIKMKYEKNEIGMEADLKKLKIDKHEAMRNMNFEEAKKIVKQMSEIRSKKNLSKIDEMAEITKVLSKEQLEKFKELHSGQGFMKHNMKMKK
jgi:Spy/CpxP family protein refolding chaperone